MSSTQATLSQNPFLVNLAASFHVQSIPLAIFILIVICLLCTGLLVIIIICVRGSLRISVQKRKPLKRLKTVYMDEIEALEEGGVEHGQLMYSLEYDIPSKVLTVIILEAKELNNDLDSDQIDAYASLKLVYERNGRYHQIGRTHKTDVRRRTKSPRWHFPCTFQVSQDDLKDAQLLFEVFDYDTIGQDRSLGRLDVSLSSIDITSYFGSPFEQISCLKPGSPKYSGLGELCVGLAYFPKTERIEVIIYEARQLTVKGLLADKKECQLSVRVALRHKAHDLKTFESTSRTELVNPYFNERTTMQLKEKHVPEACLVFELVKKRNYWRRTTLAFLTIGPNAELTTGAKHWEEMVRGSPRTQVMWHTWVPKSQNF